MVGNIASIGLRKGRFSGILVKDKGDYWVEIKIIDRF